MTEESILHNLLEAWSVARVRANHGFDDFFDVLGDSLLPICLRLTMVKVAKVLAWDCEKLVGQLSKRPNVCPEIVPLTFSDLWCHPPVLLKVLYPCLACHLLSFLEQYRIVETANSINFEAKAAALRLA